MTKKYNLLIPMAGLGSRFLKEGYKTPKQLIHIKEKQLIDLSIDSVDTKDCNLIFVVRDEQVFNFHIDKILKKKFGKDIKVVLTNGLTEGTVCSCLLAREFIDNNLPLIIHTLDIEFSPTFDPSILDTDNVDGLMLTFKSNSTNYSYAATDKEGFVTKTEEKKVISPNACVGIYGFKRGSDFCKFADEMINLNMRTNNEFYISPLYNLLIEKGLKIKTQSVEKMHIFGTPSELKFYKNNVVNVFGDKPVGLCSDHSGFDTKEMFKKVLDELNVSYIDFGTNIKTDCDYTYFIEQAVLSMNDKVTDFSFAFCRTGQGVNMCANKFPGIRSALAYDKFSMEMGIRHNCANFFAIPSRLFEGQEGKDKAQSFIQICKENTFDGGRHQARVQGLEK